jgi:hypothetical protein
MVSEITMSLVTRWLTKMPVADGEKRAFAGRELNLGVFQQTPVDNTTTLDPSFLESLRPEGRRFLDYAQRCSARVSRPVAHSR